MTKFFDTLLDYLPFIIIGLVLVILLGCVVYDAAMECCKTEVETYITGCEVTQVAYAEKASGRSTSRASYKLGVRNDEFCATIDITAEQFAMFTVGDIVEVRVTVYESLGGVQQVEYEVLGWA